MTHTPGRLAVALCLLAPGLTACGLLDGSSPIEEALEYLPAGATSVTFAADDAGGAGVSAFGDAVSVDVQVEWEASAATGSTEVRVWKVDDDTDFDAIAAALDASAGESAVRLVPDEHLVVAGDLDLAVAVAADDEDSLSDDGTFADLLDKAPDKDALEHAELTLEPLCGSAGGLTPEEAAEQYVGLFHPDRGLALFAEPDRVRAVRLFSDDETAENDARGLEDYLRERAPAAGHDIDLEVDADGDTVVADASAEDRSAMEKAWAAVDGPFACQLGK